MKKGMFGVIGFGLLLLVFISLVIYTQASGTGKESNTRGSQLSQEEKQELNNLVGQISRSLHDKKYGFVLDHAVLPNEDVEIIVKLGTEKVDKKTKKEIQQIAIGVIEDNNFNPELFQFNVTSYYKSAKEGNRFLQRLSYNDLMGDIMLSLGEEGYAVGVENEVLSDENIEVVVKLEIDNVDKKTEKEVQQIMVGVIEKNNFDPKIFHLTVTNFINVVEQMSREEQKN